MKSFDFYTYTAYIGTLSLVEAKDNTPFPELQPSRMKRGRS